MNVDISIQGISSQNVTGTAFLGEKNLQSEGPLQRVAQQLVDFILHSEQIESGTGTVEATEAPPDTPTPTGTSSDNVAEVPPKEEFFTAR